MIYQKTPAGIAEIAASIRKLNFRQRQVLILVDGKRNTDELALFLNQPNMLQILAELEKQGYIYNSAYSKPPVTPIQTEIAEQPSLNEAKIIEIKRILTDSAEQHLGIMGRGLMRKIESAELGEQLLACISQWHMAMRESRQGKEAANTLMARIQEIMKT